MSISLDTIDTVIMTVIVKFLCYIIGSEEETLNKIAILLTSFCFLTDLIVGAPYEQDNKGAIYIFNGGSPRMETMYSQRILAADINSDLRGFGFSLSKNTIDVDSNTYTGTV